ncbi:glycosyltransferase family 2 protein [Serratia sp. JSRIV004]|uniref:glycosyltransferase family 2 protein n=1 Tax=Serratia sp. JSRIV004 TaxID=2831895 RepID=UPI001CBE9843|nr:glycosyltransferase family A protein [Serratia sp. JSRIV004]UAN59429.1 glycosyltransferase family 2 protein [Serratia sp. JSRIV004]
MNVAIIIPTRNGGDLWASAVQSLSKQNDYISNVIVIDSNSTDETLKTACKVTSNIIKIDEKEFNHGGTRNLGCFLLDDNVDVVIFLTQDAVLASPESLQRIVEPFIDKSVAAAFGRQLPHENATAIAEHARIFNYPKKSYVSSLESRQKMGIKTVFISNSFSAYRLSIFKELGCFPDNTILCEDMYFAAKAVTKGYKIAYASDATVFHSHNYTPIEEFRRYFDIGVFHDNEPWIKQSFGGARGEGKKFIISELKYLLKNKPSLVPVALVNNAMKFIGYKLGGYYAVIPVPMRVKLSMHKNFWRNSIR